MKSKQSGRRCGSVAVAQHTLVPAAIKKLFKTIKMITSCVFPRAFRYDADAGNKSVCLTILS